MRTRMSFPSSSFLELSADAPLSLLLCLRSAQLVADAAIQANAENAEKQQRIRDKIAAREREFQKSLKQ